jgi:2-oxoglutarate ferredoxin oxidoreductase subunit beta
VLKSLKEAILELGIAPHEVLVVSGIGCSSNLPGFIHAYGVHSLHGRLSPSRAARRWPTMRCMSSRWEVTETATGSA